MLFGLPECISTKIFVITDKQGLDSGSRALRHVDVQRRAVLHSVHPAPGGDRRGSLLGRHQRRLHPHEEPFAYRRHDSRRLGRRTHSIACTAIRVRNLYSIYCFKSRLTVFYQY